jgi:hypothetical protein
VLILIFIRVRRSASEARKPARYFIFVRPFRLANGEAAALHCILIAKPMDRLGYRRQGEGGKDAAAWH